jgi:FAD:protein FMN transferase
MLSLPLTRPGQRFEHEAMNCVFSFVLEGAEPRYLAQSALAAAERLDALENLLSLYRESSDVAALNAAPAGETIRVAEETANCLAAALRVAAWTRSAFHPFCGASALAAKGQAPAGEGPHRPPGGDPVIALDLAGRRVTKLREGFLLDLGGVGKGFALDCVRELLREDWEVPSGLLVAGGSSVLAFSAPGAGPWPVRLAGGPALPGLRDTALAASGLGFQPGHVIDPRTSLPVATSRRVFVEAPGAAEADALATAAMVLSTSEIETLFSALPDVSLLLEDDAPPRAWGPFFASLLSF